MHAQNTFSNFLLIYIIKNKKFTLWEQSKKIKNKKNQTTILL